MTSPSKSWDAQDDYPSSFSYLGDLPIELRWEIYRHVFVPRVLTICEQNVNCITGELQEDEDHVNDLVYRPYSLPTTFRDIGRAVMVNREMRDMAEVTDYTYDWRFRGRLYCEGSANGVYADWERDTILFWGSRALFAMTAAFGGRPHDLQAEVGTSWYQSLVASHAGIRYVGLLHRPGDEPGGSFDDHLSLATFPDLRVIYMEDEPDAVFPEGEDRTKNGRIVPGGATFRELTRLGIQGARAMARNWGRYRGVYTETKVVFMERGPMEVYAGRGWLSEHIDRNPASRAVPAGHIRRVTAWEDQPHTRECNSKDDGLEGSVDGEDDEEHRQNREYAIGG